MVHLIASEEELEAKLEEAGDKVVVVDFFATWCGPCKMIALPLEELSKERKDVVFLKIDVDDNEDLAAKYEISSMPTFLFIKNKKVLGSFSGANIDKVKEAIETYQ